MEMMPWNGGGGASFVRRKIAEGGYSLFGILIYSDVDTSFVEYLRQVHDALSDLSGERIYVFSFERFEANSALLWPPGEKPMLRTDEIVRKESLKLAAVLDIPLEKTPCIVLCKTLNAEECVIYSFDGNWTRSHLTEHFKAVFDACNVLLSSSEKKSERAFLIDLAQRLDEIRFRKWVKRTVSLQSVGAIMRAIATVAPKV